MQFYGNNEDCWWNLMADDGNKLDASITYMDIQQAEACAADFLEVGLIYFLLMFNVPKNRTIGYTFA